MTDHLRLDEQLCFALHAASRAMTAAYAPLLAELDLTYPQYVVMLVLWEKDGDSVSKIGDRLYLDSATLTPLLKRLEAHELVVRKRSSEDERVVEVFLTAAGKRLRAKAAGIPACMFEKVELSVTALRALRTQLQELTLRLRDVEED
jgi:DNA-binding MarR family transcriptional regulator